MPEAALSDLAVYTARPTLRVDGEDHEMVNELLIGMRFAEAEGSLGSMQLRFSNVASRPEGEASFAFEDEELLHLGSRITVFGGDENAPQELFAGTITAIEGEFPEDNPPELAVFAEDALQLARMKRRTKLHENVTVADLARAVATALNLTPNISGFDEPIGDRMQLNESDYAFLRRTLRAYDGDLQIVGTEMHVAPRKDSQRGAVELDLYSQLRRVRVMADLAHQNTEVTVGGWDALQGVRVTASSSGANFGPGEGRTGAQILADAIGHRREHLGCPAVTTDAEAQAMAHAVYDRCARRFVCVEGTTEGNPALRVGTHVTLAGLTPRFENTYYVTRTCHRFDMTVGYQTDFEAEAAFLGLP